MKYLKKYKLFENSISNFDDVMFYINYIEDELDLEFEELKIKQSLDSIVTFIFSIAENRVPDYKKTKDIFGWFIQQIVKMDHFLDMKNQEVIKIGRDYRVKSSGKSIEFPDLTDVSIIHSSQLLRPRSSIPKYEYHVSFKVEIFTILRWVIKNPKDKELLKGSDVNAIIKELFQFYCKTLIDIDFSILSVFSKTKNKILSPVEKRSIQLPYNLSDQFIIDITPIFLRKVYKESGLIFRLKITRYEESRVSNTDRLRGTSIAQETDYVLKELGLDMTWKDIFIIED